MEPLFFLTMLVLVAHGKIQVILAWDMRFLLNLVSCVFVASPVSVSRTFDVGSIFTCSGRGFLVFVAIIPALLPSSCMETDFRAYFRA